MLPPCRLLLIPALLAATALHSIAGQSFSPTTDSSSGVSVRVESWLESCPSSGLVPLRLHVTNRSANTLSWEITAASGQLTTRGTLTVEGGRDGEMALYAMTPPMERSSGFYRNLTVNVNGPGISNNFAGQLTANTGGGSNHTEFIGMSKKLAAKGWSALKAKLDPSGRGSGVSELDGTEVDMTQAPDDWRGYAGLAQLWMDEGEWVGMSAQSKAALLDWVATGGRVCIMVGDISDARHLELKLPPLVKNKNRHGAGQFSTFQWDGKTLPIDIIARTIREAGNNSLRTQLTTYNTKWSLYQAVGELGLKSGLVFGFIAIFGILIGPVNLFWLAGPTQRQRLFWTTPLLSLAGSGILIMLMILQDGIGGNGARYILSILQPDQKKMVIVQEQSSKTGVLFRSGYTLSEPVWSQPLAINVEATPNYGMDRDRHYTKDGNACAGDWFASRAMQSQLLQTVRPSRAAIEFFPAADSGGAPSVLSSIEVALGRVFIVDEDLHYWKAENLGTGEKKTLTASSLKEYQEWQTEQTTGNGGRVTSAISQACESRAGYAYAEAKDAARLAVKTHPSIKWNTERAIFVGPYVKH